jgi:transposase
MATVQLRNPTEGRAYFDRKKADGKISMEAMRALKRRLSDIVYRRLLTDALAPSATGPGGHTRGRHFNPARPTHAPTSTLRISHFPDPPPSKPRADLAAAS